MRLNHFIAARYLRSPKSHSVINLISGVSVVAMAFPVAAVIMLLSIFNGLELIVEDMYQHSDADIRITPASGSTFAVADLDSQALHSIDGVEAISFTLEQTAMTESGDRRTFARVQGVDDNYLKVIALESDIILGEFSLERDGEPQVVAAHGVMQDLGLMRKDALATPLRLYSINRARFSSILPVGGYTRREMPLAGIYSTNQDYSSTIIISLAAAQSLFNYPDAASSVEVRTLPEEDLNMVAERIESLVGEQFEVRTRYESNSLYRLMALEKWGVFFIALVVMLIASLSIVGTLVMVIIDKQHDIQTLRTMGARENLVRAVFLSEGRLMALVSLAIGCVLGVVLTLLQQWFGFVRIDAPTLAISSYPVRLQPLDLLLTVAGYLAVSYIVINLTVRAVMSYKTSQ